VPELRQQALINAPVTVVWALVSDPNRHPEWWPKVVEAECEGLEEGCRFRVVLESPFGRPEEHEFVVERLDECREVTIRCTDVGLYTRWVLTEAQGSTFVDAQFGIDPHTIQVRAFSLVAGKRYLRRWLQQSVDGLEAAAGSPVA
jgi:uncharacterized protein YndB with AHSA1/START domain